MRDHPPRDDDFVARPLPAFDDESPLASFARYLAAGFILVIVIVGAALAVWLVGKGIANAAHTSANFDVLSEMARRAGQ